MSVSVQKIEGVETVKLSLKEGTARITLKPGNTVTIEQLRDLVRRNGFTPKEAVVTAEADVSEGPEPPELTITGTKERLRVRPDPAPGSPEVGPHRGRRVMVMGTVGAAAEGQPATIDIRSIKPADPRGH